MLGNLHSVDQHVPTLVQCPPWLFVLLLVRLVRVGRFAVRRLSSVGFSDGIAVVVRVR
jgi:hypothetical protein